MSSLDFLHGIDVVEIDDGIRVIRTAKSGIIGLVGTAGKGPLNIPVLLNGNARAAVETFGPVKEDNFTIPAALDAIFKQIGATVVVVNVADTTDETLFTDVASEELQSSGYTAAFAHDYVKDVVISGPHKVRLTAVSGGSDSPGTFDVPSGDTVTLIQDLNGDTVDAGDVVEGDVYDVTYTTPSLVENTDYVLDLDGGVLSIVPDLSHLIPGTTLTVGYSYFDGTKIVAADIIGEITGAGDYTGINVLLDAKSKVFVQPRILIAPNFTQTKANAITRNPVTDALNTVAKRLHAIAVVDTPNTTKEAAVEYMLDWGDAPRVYGHYPFYTVLKADGSGEFKSVPASPFIAGVIAMEDDVEGFWFSPSNKPVNGILGLAKPIDFSLSDANSVSNYLNSNNVTTTIFEQGLRLWGNHTGDGSFINVRRTADMVEESISLAHLWAVDRNITKGFVQSVLENVNAYLRTLVSQSAILGGKAWVDPTINTIEVLKSGHLYIDFDMTPPTPAEHLTFQAHLVDDYFATIFPTS